MSWIARALVALIAGYRRWLSPLMRPHCRYSPTCSEYALEAVAEHGAARGMVFAVKRVARCHPWGGGGLDPVPRRRAA